MTKEKLRERQEEMRMRLLREKQQEQLARRVAHGEGSYEEMVEAARARSRSPELRSRVVSWGF
jgi:hypothetical protein